MKQLSFAALLVLFSAPAMAYVGPGLGMGVIGTIFGVLAAIVLALFGLFWYPLKRAFSKKKAAAHGSQAGSIVAAGEQATHTDTRPTLPQNPSNIQPDNQVSNHPGTLNEAPDPANSNRTDSQVQ